MFDLEVAIKLGFNSVYQLKTFWMHAENNGMSVCELTKLSADDPEYRKHIGSLRKLMSGSPARGNDGFGVLVYGERHAGASGKEPTVWLTPKGRQWAKKIGFKIDY